MTNIVLGLRFASLRFASLRFASLLFACSLMLGASAVQAQQLTPAQNAYLRTENRKADEAFVRDVAKIVDVRTSVVAKAMPEHGRITDPVARLIAALEHNLGKPLTEEQKAAISAADVARQKAVENAYKSAPTR